MENKLEILKNKLSSKILDNCKLIEYINAKCVIVKTKYGKCSIPAGSLLRNQIPTIKSAIDKNEYFINMYNSKYSHIYSFDEIKYKGTHNKITIDCNKHGKFLMTPANLLFGQKCPNCARESTTNFNKENPNGWGKTSWYRKALSSENFDSFKVYILEFWDDEERFYKIGRTYTKIEKRFSSTKEMPYKYKVLKIYKGNAEYIYKLENILKKLNKKHKYAPKIVFNGYRECFLEVKDLFN